MTSNEHPNESNKSIELIKLLINKTNKVIYKIRKKLSEEHELLIFSKADKTANIKLEKKILEEIYKIFQENNGSFYFSYTYDLTNSIERQHSNSYDDNKPTWKRADNRFFWNYLLVDDLMGSTPECHDSFIIPIIQGFVETENVNIDPRFVNNEEESGQIEFSNLKFSLISRRSRHRLGNFTSYLKLKFYQ